MKTKRYAFNTVITIPIDAVKTCMKAELIGKFRNLAINLLQKIFHFEEFTL